MDVFSPTMFQKVERSAWVGQLMRFDPFDFAKVLSPYMKEMIESQRFEKGEKREGKKSKKLRKTKDSDSEQRYCSAEQNLTDERSPRTRSVSPPLHFSLVASKFLPLKKLHEIYSKIVVQLETVKNLSESKSNEVDNLLELRRQLQRADEFSIRFSRNNLYETKRLISEIKKLIAEVLPTRNHSSNECKLLSKKIIMGYQAASQSLQIYINYVKNPSNLEVPEKINELVLQIADLFLCCEHLSLPADEFSIQNSAVKICNELLAVLKSKISTCVLMTMKEEDVLKKKGAACPENSNKKEKLSMYKSKLTVGSSKGRGEPGQKKKFGISCLLGNKARRMKKKDEKKARMTHEIYTQKMYPRSGKPFPNKDVQFEASKTLEKNQSEPNLNGKPRRHKFFTPREVKCQDDDVETMVQAIGDDDIVTSRIEADESRELGQTSDASSNLNNLSIRELLLEAIEDLQSSDKKEQKATLKKLLTSIQNCSKNQRPPNVTVFHFKSRDLEEEGQEQGRSQDEEPKSQYSVDLNALNEDIKAKEELLCKERRLNIIFKQVKQKKSEETFSKKITGKGKIILKLSEESAANANKYKKSFAEFRRNNIMYKKNQANKPWELVEKVSDRIVVDIIKEISMDFENDAILRRLYLNELLEVIN